MTTDPEERLHARTLGSAGPRVVFVHGLFGQGKNWTTAARGLADFLLDEVPDAAGRGVAVGYDGRISSPWRRA